MSNQNNNQESDQKTERLVFIPQSEVENQLSQTIKQYADVEGVQIHDLLLEALLHLAVEKDIFVPSAVSSIKRSLPKCAMRDCKEPAQFEALYKLDNSIKLLCFCHGNNVATNLQRGTAANLWAYCKRIPEESA